VQFLLLKSVIVYAPQFEILTYLASVVGQLMSFITMLS